MSTPERALRRLRDAYGAGHVSTATLEARAALALRGQVEDAIWDLPRWRLTRDPVRALVVGSREWPLNRAGRWTLGRSADCDICIPDDAVSRHHAELAVRAGICLIRDLSSVNGTLLNGRPITRARLHRGDVLELGETEIDIR
ncbi:FHA domain-containing protein [Solirubrobacter sp. CPCC 204708]|uniref:FHA domain-containing protein n=1 Tax=Solirubrobacter deserti TaxID=2282478 RepID=A0ABT4RVG3_9ACTN|nr:FHA domain-containing protein [Solirubrobacter deserti]MBE2320956.1 FHA domain-containing protein [Solirubrobacter deserti]MDA0142251.1 FHA domain-containing protein [Solirubrobacter deserti]